MTGQAISHHRILDRLGKGGIGDVCEAGDTRFERDARAISSLNHPNICALLPRSAIHVVPNWTADLVR